MLHQLWSKLSQFNVLITLYKVHRILNCVQHRFEWGLKEEKSHRFSYMHMFLSIVLFIMSHGGVVQDSTWNLQRTRLTLHWLVIGVTYMYRTIKYITS